MMRLVVFRTSAPCAPTTVSNCLLRRRFLSSNSKRSSARSYNKQKKGPKTKGRSRLPPPAPRIPKLNATNTPASQSAVPPVYLRATASPYAFVAAAATHEYDLDPKSLFTEQDPPACFTNVQYAYISPKSFGHELPAYSIPEVCFLGRSNVGKSSLLNALTKTSDLARCSKQPGRTQQVNYFGMFPRNTTDNNNLSSATGFLVDLPGYGFAKAPGKLVQGWQKTTQEYLLQRRDSGHMRRVFLLVDARRGPLQLDRIIMGWFDEADMEYSVVLTKADRVGRAQQVKCVNEICMRYDSQLAEGYGQQNPVVHVTSARDGLGLNELMIAIDAEFLGYRERDDEVGGES